MLSRPIAHWRQHELWCLEGELKSIRVEVRLTRFDLTTARVIIFVGMCV